MYCSAACRDIGKVRDPVERFWSFVKKTDGCWIWSGANVAGYGALSVPEGMERRAHRFSWVLHYGAIQQGLDVLHRCDNPPCVRPDHLFLGTALDNARDMASKGRSGATKHPEKISRGESRPASKLTEKDVVNIRRLHADGKTQKEIAQKYNVTSALISGIVRKVGWKHIT